MNGSMSFRSIVRMLMLAFVVTVPGATVVYSQTSSSNTRKASHLSLQKQLVADVLIEEFSFLLKDFKIDHQGETNVLNISISYRYAANIANSEYPDFRSLAKDVEIYLTSYPNEDDYWEIVNKQITSLLLKKYPTIMSVTCELKVEPSRMVPYTRSSRATRERALRRRR